MERIAFVRGGGDLGTGVAHALHRRGLSVVVLDRPLPTALRLSVAFAAAAVLPGGRLEVDGVEAALCARAEEVRGAWAAGRVALWVGPEDALRESLRPHVLVDARMRALTEPVTSIGEARVVI